MNKYIKREELIGEFHRLKLGENSVIERLFADGVYAVIETFPAADVVEVVRCKDCKYRVPLDRHCNISPFYGHCTEWHGEETKNVWHKYKKYYKDYSIVEPDGYCSFGERKEEVE